MKSSKNPSAACSFNCSVGIFRYHTTIGKKECRSKMRYIKIRVYVSNTVEEYCTGSAVFCFSRVEICHTKTFNGIRDCLFPDSPCIVVGNKGFTSYFGGAVLYFIFIFIAPTIVNCPKINLLRSNSECCANFTVKIVFQISLTVTVIFAPCITSTLSYICFALTIFAVCANKFFMMPL